MHEEMKSKRFKEYIFDRGNLVARIYHVQFPIVFARGCIETAGTW